MVTRTFWLWQSSTISERPSRNGLQKKLLQQLLAFGSCLRRLPGSCASLSLFRVLRFENPSPHQVRSLCTHASGKLLQVCRKSSYKGSVQGLTNLPVDGCTVLGILVMQATLLPTQSFNADSIVECVRVLQSLEQHMHVNGPFQLLPSGDIFRMEVQENQVHVLKASIGAQGARPELVQAPRLLVSLLVIGAGGVILM